MQNQSIQTALDKQYDEVKSIRGAMKAQGGQLTPT